MWSPTRRSTRGRSCRRRTTSGQRRGSQRAGGGGARGVFFGGLDCWRAGLGGLDCWRAGLSWVGGSGGFRGSVAHTPAETPSPPPPGRWWSSTASSTASGVGGAGAGRPALPPPAGLCAFAPLLEPWCKGAKAQAAPPAGPPSSTPPSPITPKPWTPKPATPPGGYYPGFAFGELSKLSKEFIPGFEAAYYIRCVFPNVWFSKRFLQL